MESLLNALPRLVELCQTPGHVSSVHAGGPQAGVGDVNETSLP